MKLLRKILIERITDADQLASGEREQVKADPALQAAVRENLGLARLKGTGAGAPDREAVLRAALSRTTDGGHQMNLIERLFTGRKWYFQLGAAALLLAAITMLALLPRTSSWAQTNGYVLKFDFGQVVDPDDETGVRAAVQDQLAELEAALKDWPREEHAKSEEGNAECEVMINVNIDKGYLTAMVALVDADRTELENLGEWLADKPGVPQPQITEATWFHPGGKLDPSAGISFNIMDHLFSFPTSATESEIEQTVNSWLRENKPDFDGSVDVTINRSSSSEDGKEDEKIEVMIKLKKASGE